VTKRSVKIQELDLGDDGNLDALNAAENVTRLVDRNQGS
jgi:hypothetical protein